MGDLRDQLKKIKNALGLGGGDKKSPDSERPSARKSIEVTVKKNRTGSLPPSAAKPIPDARKVQTSKRPQQAFQKKAHPASSKSSTGQRSDQKSDQSYVSPSGVTITRTIAPGAMLKPAPAPTLITTTTAPSAPAPSTAQAGQLTLPGFTALTRKSEFRTPDAWVTRGASSQLGAHPSVRRRDIFIGLDCRFLCSRFCRLS